jgi:hypothetical protein
MLKNELNDVISRGDNKEYRKFGITVGMVLGLISVFLFWKSKGAAPYLLATGVIFILFGIVIPKILKYIYIIWMSFAVVMGFYISRMILSSFYLIVFAPVGIVTRLLGKDLLKEKWDKNARSYWIIREPRPYDPQSSEKQY